MRLYTQQDLVEILSVSLSTIYRLRRNETLRCIKISDGQRGPVRFTEEQVQKFLAERQQTRISVALHGAPQTARSTTKAIDDALVESGRLLYRIQAARKRGDHFEFGRLQAKQVKLRAKLRALSR